MTGKREKIDWFDHNFETLSQTILNEAEADSTNSLLFYNFLQLFDIPIFYLSLMVEQLTYDPEIKGSNPDIGHWERDNMAGYFNDIR